MAYEDRYRKRAWNKRFGDTRSARKRRSGSESEELSEKSKEMNEQ